MENINKRYLKLAHSQLKHHLSGQRFENEDDLKKKLRGGEAVWQ